MKRRLFLVVIFAICYFGVNSQTLVGKYSHFTSKIMGGYKISQTSELTIQIEGNNKITYSITATLVDEYSGGRPQYSYYSGDIKKVTPLKYKFYGDAYGERGAYITFKKVPKDPVGELLISFSPGRGNQMSFVRQE